MDCRVGNMPAIRPDALLKDSRAVAAADGGMGGSAHLRQRIASAPLPRLQSTPYFWHRSVRALIAACWPAFWKIR